jgi:hypothetical protein
MTPPDVSYFWTGDVVFVFPSAQYAAGRVHHSMRQIRSSLFRRSGYFQRHVSAGFSRRHMPRKIIRGADEHRKAVSEKCTHPQLYLPDIFVKNDAEQGLKDERERHGDDQAQHTHNIGTDIEREKHHDGVEICGFRKDLG